MPVLYYDLTMNAQAQRNMDWSYQQRHAGQSSFKDRLFNHFGQRNYGNGCHQDFSLQPFLDKLGRSIETKVEKCKEKAIKKIEKKLESNKQDLKGFIMRKVFDAFTDRDQPNVPLAPERPREEIQANYQVVSSPQEQIVQANSNSTVTCQYCNDSIIAGYYEEHLASCHMARCGDCGGFYKLTEAQTHFKECQGNIENITIPCEQCNKMVPLSNYFYHQSLCVSQYQNNNHHHREEQRSSEIQVSECAICLLEIKRDGSGKFLECAHHFHGDCIDSWARKQKACPICMHEF